MIEGEDHLRAMTAAIARARKEGYTLAPDPLPRGVCSAIEHEANGLSFDQLDTTLKVVRQRGWFVRPQAVDAPLTWQVGRLVQRAAALADVAFEGNEATFQRYSAGAGVSAHLDTAYYVGLIVVFNIAGDGLFEILSDRECRQISASWRLMAGDVVILDADRRPRVMHRVLSPNEGRLSLTIRHDSRAPDKVGAI